MSVPRKKFSFDGVPVSFWTFLVPHFESLRCTRLLFRASHPSQLAAVRHASPPLNVSYTCCLWLSFLKTFWSQNRAFTPFSPIEISVRFWSYTAVHSHSGSPHVTPTHVAATLKVSIIVSPWPPPPSSPPLLWGWRYLQDYLNKIRQHFFFVAIDSGDERGWFSWCAALESLLPVSTMRTFGPSDIVHHCNDETCVWNKCFFFIHIFYSTIHDQERRSQVWGWILHNQNRRSRFKVW